MSDWYPADAVSVGWISVRHRSDNFCYLCRGVIYHPEYPNPFYSTEFYKYFRSHQNLKIFCLQGQNTKQVGLDVIKQNIGSVLIFFTVFHESQMFLANMLTGEWNTVRNMNNQNCVYLLHHATIMFTNRHHWVLSLRWSHYSVV